jgi:Leucine-rich repeat (LRR) protein
MPVASTMDIKLVIRFVSFFGMLWAVSAACPASCKCLPAIATVTFECDKLTEAQLTAAITELKKTATVVSLKLTNYAAVELKSDSFKDASQIVSLSLTGSANLAKVDANAFNGLTKLTELTISDSPKLTTLPEAVFQPLKTTLVKLTLTKSKLATLPENIFKDLEKLTTLTLDENVLVKLEKSNFENIKTIKTVTIEVKKNAYNCECKTNTELGHWISDNSLKISIECKLPAALVGKLLGKKEWVEACPKPTTTSPAPTTKDSKTSATPEAEPKFPDWALVIIIAIIGAIILIVIGVFCQISKKRYHQQQKQRELASGMPQTRGGYDNQGYMTNP